MCRRHARNAADANDLKQEVFLRIFRTIRSLSSHEVIFEKWLAVVTRNLLTDHYRRTHWERRVVAIDEHVATRHRPSEAEGPDHAYIRRETQRAVRSALSKLPQEMRAPVVMHHMMDLRQIDIAAKTGVPDGTVKSRLNRGRSLMAQLLRTYRKAA
jgi:RNA polymerase sigma-70 factor (ECF subfamily)